MSLDCLDYLATEERRDDLETQDGLPQAELYGDLQVRLWCQHCELWHYHGHAGDQVGTITHRVAHCTKQGSPYDRDGYEFVIVTGR